MVKHIGLLGYFFDALVALLHYIDISMQSFNLSNRLNTKFSYTCPVN